MPRRHATAFAASGSCGKACRPAPASRSREPPLVTPREPRPAAREVRWSRVPVLWLTAWTGFVRRHSIAVLAFSLVSAVLAGAYAAKNVTINTSTADMLSEDLPFRRHFDELDRAFPQDNRTIVVVIDGDTPEQARTAAEGLAEQL